MRYDVVFDPAADADLAEIFDYIASKAGRSVARPYIEALLEYCAAFETFPERGMRRDEIGTGIRIVGFRRKASIVFKVENARVTIIRILHRGRSLGSDMDADDGDHG